MKTRAQKDHEVSQSIPPQPERNVALQAPKAVPQLYTENEVAAMLRIPLSQLRKWRMPSHPRKSQGPRFKKLGRSVRYSEQALIDFINAS
jgi:Helix-turn-helix domain